MPAPVESHGFSSEAAYKKHERLRAKARRRALTKLAQLHPVQFEQLVIAELAALRREQNKGGDVNG